VVDETAVSRFDKGAPRFDVMILEGIRPVNEVQVDVVQTHSHDAFLDGSQSVVKMVMTPGQFRCHDQFVTWQARTSNGGADRALVLVIEGGVEQSIAGANCFDDRVGPVNSVKGVGAESDSG
jgi:hypothetical protein